MIPRTTHIEVQVDDDVEVSNVGGASATGDWMSGMTTLVVYAGTTHVTFRGSHAAIKSMLGQIAEKAVP